MSLPIRVVPLTKQFLPPPGAAIDPLERLGIDISRVAGPADFRGALATLFAALARGEIGAAEAGHICRRLHSRIRLLRRLARPLKRLRLTAGGKPR